MCSTLGRACARDVIGNDAGSVPSAGGEAGGELLMEKGQEGCGSGGRSTHLVAKTRVLANTAELGCVPTESSVEHDEIGG